MRLRHLLKTTALTTLLLIAGKVGWGQTTYVWNNAAGGTYGTAANWTPSRDIPATTDILTFSDGGTYTVTGIATQTIGQLLISNNTKVTIQSGAAATITISGDIGVDLNIASGSELNLTGTNFAITITLSSGATASVSGNMTFGGASANTAHRLTAASASAITFNNGSIFTADAFFNGNAFGSAAGNTNTVIFASGSKYVGKAGSNPFGVSAPASAVIFQTGSTYSLEASLTPALSNRTYANFVINYTGAAIAPSGTAPCRIDNLTILSGSVGITTALPILISNDLSVSSGATFNYSPATSNTTGMIFCGSGTQSVNNAGTLTLGANANIIVKEGSTVQLSSDITVLGKTTVAGTLNAAGKVLSGATGSIVSGNSSTTLAGALVTTSNGVTVTSTTGVEPGMLVTGDAAIPANTYVTSTGGTTTIFISNYPTAAVPSASLTYTRVSGTIISGHANGLNGSLTIAGAKTFDANTSFEFNGSVAQITGALLPATIKNLTINNSAGVTLSGNTTVSNALTLTSGKFDLGAYNLTIGSAGSIVGADATKYVITSGAGLLKMNTLAVGTATYPIGSSATSYTPFLSINNTSSDVLGVKVRNTFTNAPLDAEKTVKLEWFGTEGLAGGNDGTITFSWNVSDQGTTFNPAQPVLFGVWDGSKYTTTPVSVDGAGPYTVTITAPATYPAFPVIFGNTGAFPADAPVLTVATVNNDVEHNFDITYPADAAYLAAINDVKVDGTSLNAADWDKTAAGIITLKPTVGNALLRASGTKTITVIATGYINATVSQIIKAGLAVVANSTISNAPAIGIGSPTTVTLTAKDQFSNLVSGYEFKYDATVTNADATTPESYTIATNATTANVIDIILPVTNASGVATFNIALPLTVDPLDGISVQVQMNDGSTNLGSALSYFAPAGPTVSIAATLEETTLNGATIAMTVQSETFANAVLDKANFTLNNAPTGVTINDVLYNSTTSATVTLAYDGTDFDATVNNLSVTVAGVELTLGGPLTSNNLTITALVEVAPTVTTDAAITTNGITTATWGGAITADGGELVTEKGICWSTATNPTTADNKVVDAVVGTTITGNLTGLTPNTLYYVKAYAINLIGTGYSTEERTFTTLKSSEKAITATTIGTIDEPNKKILNVPGPKTVTQLKAAITVSPLATFEVYTAAGGSTVATGTSLVSPLFVVKVTAQDLTTQEYALTIEVISVDNLLALQSLPANTRALYTGKATITYTRTSRNQKYIQDATGAILIDDATAAPGYIAGTYAIGDGITNIEGKIVPYYGIVEFVPTSTTGATCTGNPVITPEVRTMASLTSADQSKLIKVMNFNFTPATGNFAASTNYIINDGTTRDTTCFFRTAFAEANYITTPTAVPTAPINSTALVVLYQPKVSSKTAIQIVARNFADMQFTGATVTSTVYTVTATDITNIPFTATLAEFKANLIPATGATFEVYQSDGTTVATAMATGNKVIVTAQDAVTQKTYTITINSVSSAKEITAFSIGTYTGTISGTNISVEVGSSYDLSSLVATFTLSLGASATVGGVAQVSGTTANNFVSAVTYIVTAEDASTKSWTITVTKAAAGASDLFFSEYIEGTSNNKTFEIYNPGATAVDLSAYTVKQSYNGGGWGKRSGLADSRYVLTFPVGTMIQPKDVYVIYAVADPAFSQVNAPEVVAAADLGLVYNSTANGGNGTNVASFTGNDALGLYKGATLLDVFGGELITTIFNVAGNAGYGENHTIVRKPAVHAGNPDWTSSTGTDATTSEWIVYDIDTWTYLGAHTENTSSAPSITVSTPTLASFGHIDINNQSDEKSFTVQGLNLNGNVVITAPAGFWITLNGGITFTGNDSPITILAAAAVNPTTIYVKFAPTAVQAYSENITITSAGAPDKTVAVSGDAIVPTVTVSVATLTSFGNVTVNTTSATQRDFTVIGSNLTANLVVTAPTGFLISKLSGGSFTNESSISLTPTEAQTLTTIYVAFHPTSVASYVGNITVATTGVTTKNVAVSGAGLSTGINDNWDSNLKSYPNPFTNEIRFEGAQNVKRVIVTTVTGQVLRDVVIGENNSVDTQDLLQGMYLVTFMNDKGEKAIHKMIKQ